MFYDLLTHTSYQGGEATSRGRGPKEEPLSDARKAQMGELLQLEEMGDHMEGKNIFVA